MPRRRLYPSDVALLALILTGGAAINDARAQGTPLTTPTLPQADKPTVTTVPKDTTPPTPNAVQPSLPGSAQASPPKPESPVVEQIVQRRQPPLVVRKQARLAPYRHYAWHGHARRHYGDRGLERPALAGVELLAPLPPPVEPPHVVVPTPAFPLESFAAAYTTPPPPIVCHPARRESGVPDPRLYREVPVECEPDNP